MKRKTFLFITALIICSYVFSQTKARPTIETSRDIYADTWVGTDALGRTMPGINVAGPVKKDHPRVVAMFYITWHADDNAQLKSPYAGNVTNVLATDTNARLDAGNPQWKEFSYHWNEPELGYFLSKDEFVIRKDMSMLADAGVDVLVMDVTNAVRYWSEWEKIFSVMEQMKAEGNKVPKFCFWAFNGSVITVVQELYDRIYKAGKYNDLWFYWQGKPLLLYNKYPITDVKKGGFDNPNPHYDSLANTDKANPHFHNPDYTDKFYKNYTKDVQNAFTLRTMWWGYYEWEGKRFLGTEDNWSFGYDMGDSKVEALPLDSLVSYHKGKVEEMAVTPAQHPSSLVGKSWTRMHHEPMLNSYDLPDSGYMPSKKTFVSEPQQYGIYFQERWDEALTVDPPFIYLNDWNEWTAGKYQPAPGTTFDFMRRKNSYFFVDQYNAEFNRSIQPMKGGYTDNYYMQMAENIRKYKGVRSAPVSTGQQNILTDGNFTDWNKVEIEYRDTKGDVVHRAHAGYGGSFYTDSSGRNDIVTAKVAVNKNSIHFYAETAEPLTSSGGNNWMLLLIDADQNNNTGWNGYDLIVNKKVLNDSVTTIMRYDEKTNNWKEAGKINYRYKQNKLELSIPGKYFTGKKDSNSFDFHWCDNPSDLTDIISLCTTGDSAPNRRFNYRFTWKR